MPLDRTVSHSWTEQEFPPGTQASSGAAIALRKVDGSVQEFQTAMVEGEPLVFTVPAGTGWYFTGQTMAGTQAIGEEVRSGAFDVIDPPVKVKILTALAVT